MMGYGVVSNPIASFTAFGTVGVGALVREIAILDEYGERRTILIPVERPLTVFVDKRELVTLMTLGAQPAVSRRHKARPQSAPAPRTPPRL